MSPQIDFPSILLEREEALHESSCKNDFPQNCKTCDYFNTKMSLFVKERFVSSSFLEHGKENIENGSVCVQNVSKMQQSKMDEIKNLAKTIEKPCSFLIYKCGSTYFTFSGKSRQSCFRVRSKCRVGNNNNPYSKRCNGHSQLSSSANDDIGNVSFSDTALDCCNLSQKPASAQSKCDLPKSTLHNLWKTLKRNGLIFVLLLLVNSSLGYETQNDYKSLAPRPCLLAHPSTLLVYDRHPSNCSIFYLCHGNKFWSKICGGSNGAVFSLKHKVCVWKNSKFDDCPDSIINNQNLPFDEDNKQTIINYQENNIHFKSGSNLDDKLFDKQKHTENVNVPFSWKSSYKVREILETDEANKFVHKETNIDTHLTTKNDGLLSTKKNLITNNSNKQENRIRIQHNPMTSKLKINTKSQSKHFSEPDIKFVAGDYKEEDNTTAGSDGNHHHHHLVPSQYSRLATTRLQQSLFRASVNNKNKSELSENKLNNYSVKIKLLSNGNSRKVNKKIREKSNRTYQQILDNDWQATSKVGTKYRHQEDQDFSQLFGNEKAHKENPTFDYAEQNNWAAHSLLNNSTSEEQMKHISADTDYGKSAILPSFSSKIVDQSLDNLNKDKTSFQDETLQAKAGLSLKSTKTVEVSIPHLKYLASTSQSLPVIPQKVQLVENSVPNFTNPDLNTEQGERNGLHTNIGGTEVIESHFVDKYWLKKPSEGNLRKNIDKVANMPDNTSSRSNGKQTNLIMFPKDLILSNNNSTVNQFREKNMSRINSVLGNGFSRWHDLNKNTPNMMLNIKSQLPRKESQSFFSKSLPISSFLKTSQEAKEVKDYYKNNNNKDVKYFSRSDQFGSSKTIISSSTKMIYKGQPVHPRQSREVLKVQPWPGLTKKLRNLPTKNKLQTEPNTKLTQNFKAADNPRLLKYFLQMIDVTIHQKDNKLTDKRNDFRDKSDNRNDFRDKNGQFSREILHSHIKNKSNNLRATQRDTKNLTNKLLSPRKLLPLHARHSKKVFSDSKINPGRLFKTKHGKAIPKFSRDEYNVNKNYDRNQRINSNNSTEENKIVREISRVLNNWYSLLPQQKNEHLLEQRQQNQKSPTQSKHSQELPLSDTQNQRSLLQRQEHPNLQKHRQHNHYSPLPDNNYLVSPLPSKEHQLLPEQPTLNRDFYQHQQTLEKYKSQKERNNYKTSLQTQHKTNVSLLKKKPKKQLFKNPEWKSSVPEFKLNNRKRNWNTSPQEKQHSNQDNKNFYYKHGHKFFNENKKSSLKTPEEEQTPDKQSFRKMSSPPDLDSNKNKEHSKSQHKTADDFNTAKNIKNMFLVDNLKDNLKGQHKNIENDNSEDNKVNRTYERRTEHKIKEIPIFYTENDIDNEKSILKYADEFEFSFKAYPGPIDFVPLTTTVATSTISTVQATSTARTTAGPDVKATRRTDEKKGHFAKDTDFVPPYRRELQEQCGVLATPLIIGGQTSRQGQWPWQVSLQIVTSTTPWHRCGGVLVHPRWVLTAAHCMEGTFYGEMKNWRVVMADYDLDTVSGNEIYRDIVRIVSHPGYVRTSNFPNDVALLELDSPVDMTSGDVQTACLPDTSFSLLPSSRCWISGMGETRGTGGQENKMNEVHVEVLPHDQCKSMWGKVNIDVLDSQVCLGYGQIGACYGDSGGPLMCESEGRFYVAGVMSWLINNCSANNFPNVFTRLPTYMDWVHNELDYFEWSRYH